MRTTDPNLVLLTRAVAQLGPLVERVVFLGGCATALLLTDPAASEVRPTQDADIITEVGSLTYYYRLRKACAQLASSRTRAPEPRFVDL